MRQEAPNSSSERRARWEVCPRCATPSESTHCEVRRATLAVAGGCLRLLCGEGGIRTLGTVTRTHDFQSCTFGHSVTSPEPQTGPSGGRLRGCLLSVRGRHPAEREGFEPSVPSLVHLISNQAPSATRTSLRGGIWQPSPGLSTALDRTFVPATGPARGGHVRVVMMPEVSGNDDFGEVTRYARQSTLVSAPGSGAKGDQISPT